MTARELRADSARALGPDGPFARAFAGYRYREAQCRLARKIESTIDDHGTLVAESGTGTGKTFAYLVPAVLSGKRVVISTGTKPLQEQLFQRDLPTVLQILSQRPSVALLKGRANYLCLHRLETTSAQGTLSSATNRQIESIRTWSQQTRCGDISEFDAIGEGDPVWPQVTSTADNCLGNQCRFAESCFVNRARRRAHESTVLIVNHHLFCADLVLRDDGFGQLLPAAEAVIFDEAHQLPSIASSFLGNSISANQILDLCRDTLMEEQREQSLIEDIDTLVPQVENHISGLLGTIHSSERRLDWDALEQAAGFHGAWSALTDTVSGLADTLEQAAPAGEGLTRCWERALDLAQRLDRFRDCADDTVVRWAQVSGRSFRCHETPLDIGSILAPHLCQHQRALVFTSATLTVDGHFDYFMTQIGLQGGEQITVDSPFDYGRQTLLYLPPDMPDPRSADFVEQLVETVLPVLRASEGRAFLLFTSHKALRRAADCLAPLGEFEIFEQGQAPRSRLLSRFLDSHRALLLGTASFWEGVDVRGDALSCVVIDKLPFAPPDEPVLKARLAALEAQGQRPFMDYQLPNAVLTLKQGAGRLIRDVSDRGVLVLCDPRLTRRGYGKVFLNSLPPLPVTRELSDVLAFFAATGEHKN